MSCQFCSDSTTGVVIDIDDDSDAKFDQYSWDGLENQQGLSYASTYYGGQGEFVLNCRDALC